MMGQTTFRRALSIGALSAFMLVASGAGAQTDAERAGARAAASEGLKAFKAGDYAKAVDLFSRAQSLVDAPPHLLYIARSQEKLGHLVKAHEAYVKITREKLTPDAPDAFRDAMEKAQTELKALEPRLPYLTISVTGDGADGAVVTMDGKEVPKALVGVPAPVDPGKHELQATGDGVQSDLATITLAESARETVKLNLAPAPGATVPGGTPGAEPNGSEPAGTPPTTEPTHDKGGLSGMRIGAYAALGVGVVGLGAGTFFALRSKSKRDDANALCTSAGCPADKKSEIEDLDSAADSAKTNATIGFIVGGVGVAAGVTLLVLDMTQKKDQAGIQPWVGLGSAGVAGRF
ncbi:MAG: hypothetical protein KC776_01425 [Myxococcales bacterium]|nr:hypothetical protein [Myxococcales bacterium]MCB9583275.1 hypothetical protein [Polyangiaceae bacterium]